MTRWWLLLSMLGACRSHFDGVADGVTGDGVGRCSGAFGTPELVPGLASAGNEDLMRLAADELTGVMGSDRSGTGEVYYLSRPDIGSTFSVTALSEANAGGNASDPTISSDGLTVIFLSTRAGGMSLDPDLWQMTRPSVTAPFAAPALLTVVNSVNSEFAPFLHADGDELWFVSDRGSSSPRLFRSGRDPGTGVVSVPALVQELDTTGVEFDPVLTADKLTIYFSVNEDIVMATRPARNALFGIPTPLPDLSVAGVIDGPSWISPDGCRLYLRSERSGPSRIYVATRSL